MRRVVCHEFAPVDRLEVEEMADPEPGRGEVVVAVEAAGVNFVDGLIVEGRYQIKPPLPFTPGSEVAGVITATGDDVTGVAIGDRVMAHPWLGGFASHVVSPATAVTPLPLGVTVGQAAVLGQSYSTMLYAYTRRTAVEAGEWVAVLGAGGGIGLAAVDLAAALGARVVACASSPAKLAAARAAGAEATVHYDDPDVDLKAAIRDATGGGADVLVDPVGGRHAESALRALRWFGRYLVIGFAAGSIPSLPLNQMLLNNRTVIGVDWGAWTTRDRAGAATLNRELVGLLDEGRLHPTEPTTYPLDRVAEALAALAARQVTGKLVLTP